MRRIHVAVDIEFKRGIQGEQPWAANDLSVIAAFLWTPHETIVITSQHTGFGKRPIDVVAER